VKLSFLILLFILTSCRSTLVPDRKEATKQDFSYLDVSGKYRLIHESKMIDRKVVTRNQLLADSGLVKKPLEKSIAVSLLGTVKDGKKRVLSLRPMASEFTVWLEGKKYSSRMKLDTKTKTMQVLLESPEKKWQGQQTIKFPSGKFFCFYSQIPECLFHLKFLSQARNNKTLRLPFIVIWDNYPFMEEQFAGVGSELFIPATLQFDGKVKELYRYLVEIGGQSVLYHFSKSFDLVKMSWIAQGITVVPVGQEANIDD
jgi:hypothetical protein